MPDVELHADAGTTRLYRALSEGRHLLLVSDPDPETRTWLGKAGIDSFAGVVDIAEADLRAMSVLRDGASGAFALVRPDGVLAARGSRRDTRRAIDYLRQICGGVAPSTRTLDLKV